MTNKASYFTAALTAVLLISLFPAAAFSQADPAAAEWENVPASEIHRQLGEAKAAALAGKEMARRMALQDVAADYQMNYDVLFYDVWLRVNDTTEILYGNVRTVAQATEDGVTEVDLDLYSTMVADSIVAPSGALAFSRSGNVVTITLDGTYNTDGQFEFDFYYHGHPVEGGLQAFAFDVRNFKKVITSLSEPYFARTWWPCKDRMDDKPDSMKIAIVVDTTFYVGSNGTLDSTVAYGNNAHTFYYNVSYPIATYLFSVAISDYFVWHDEWVYNGDADTMPITHAVYPDLEMYSYEKFDITPYAISVYSDQYGLYPFVREKYGHSNFEWGGAMEHQTMTSTAGSSFGFSEPVVVHELSHQWWGDMITCETWEDIWLNEGWASYSEALYYLEKDGWTSYRNYMNTMRYTGGGTVWCDDTTNVWRIFNGGLSYDKGAWVVHMLRGVLGETKFFDGVNAYYNSEYQYGATTTEGFRDVWEAATGEELDWFFEDWIYGTYLPNYRWTYYTEPASGGGYDVYVHVDQVQTTAPLVFRMPVDFAFGFPTNPTEVFKLKLDQRYDNRFKLHFSEEPTSIAVDPDDWVLLYDTYQSWTLHIVTPKDELTEARRYVAYLDTVEARGASGEYTFTVASGNLPPGLILATNGVISGTPTDSGLFTFAVVADDNEGSLSDLAEFSMHVTYSPTGLAGDANNNGKTNVADITYLVAFLFGIPTGPYPPAPNQADVNNSCTMNVSDVSYLVAYLFGIPTGPPPDMGCVVIE